MALGKIVVAGLGPGAIPAIDQRVWDLLPGVGEIVFRTEIHPGAKEAKSKLKSAKPDLKFTSFDVLYEETTSFDVLYEEMARRLIDISNSISEMILYLVPGSPLVAEKSVVFLRDIAPEVVEVLPGLSFLELVWSALGIDPFEKGVSMIDASEFSNLAKLSIGPFLLTQVWSRQLLSDIKLAVEEPKGCKATVLQRLGSEDEVVVEVEWDDLDRVVTPDHLTSIYIEKLPATPGPALVELYEIIARLRVECPWDRDQTHQSLVRHLLEESYEVVDVIEKLGEEGSEDSPILFEELKGELGDLLVQVYFHANLAFEHGHFDLGEVAATVTSKLIRRHPHVFGDLEVSGSDQVVSNWEKIKRTEHGRSSILDGIPSSLPSLLLAPKLLRKATAVGIEIPNEYESLSRVMRAQAELTEAIGDESSDIETAFGEMLWWVVNLAKARGIDLESALRSRAKEFMKAMRDAEINGN